MATFVTDTQLLDYLGAAIRKGDHTNLATPWTALGTRCNNKAYQQIFNLLASRGYTAAQIAAWDDGVEYNYALGLYWLLFHGAAIENTGYSLEAIKAFDVREELQTLLLVVSGEVVAPAGTVGQPQTGIIIDENDEAMHRRDFNARPDWEPDSQFWGWGDNW